MVATADHQRALLGATMLQENLLCAKRISGRPAYNAMVLQEQPTERSKNQMHPSDMQRPERSLSNAQLGTALLPEMKALAHRRLAQATGTPYPIKAIGRYRKCIEYAERGEYENAEGSCDAVLKICPEYRYAHAAKGWVPVIPGRCEDAEGSCDEALATDPKFKHVCEVKAGAQRCLGDFKGYAECLGRAPGINMDNADARARGKA